MAERRPVRDDLSGERREYRAARVEGNETAGDGTKVRTVPNDDAQVASEPMILEQLPDETRAPKPANRQRSGDPPAA